MKIQAVAAEGAYAEVAAQQEGAYVMLILSRPDGDEENDQEPDLRIDTMMTPDQAESMAFALSEIAKNARAYGIEEAGK